MKLIYSVLATIALLVCFPARSATITWTNTSGGYWSTNSNWSPNQQPSNTDTVLITRPGTYTVILDTTSFVESYNVTLGAGGGAAGVQTFAMTNVVFSYTNMLITNGGVLTAVDESEVGGGLPQTLTLNGGLLNLSGSSVVDTLIVTNHGVVNSTNGSFGTVTIATNGVINSQMDSLGGGAFTVAGGGVLNQYRMEIGLAGPAVSMLIASNGVMNLLDGPAVYPYNIGSLNGPLTNYGTINITNTGFNIGYGTGRGGIYNEPGGTINLRGDVNVISGIGDDDLSETFLTNRGVLNETAGTGSSLAFADYDNTQGAITNLSGFMVLETLNNMTGTYDAGTGATIELIANSSILTLGTPLVLAGNGQIELDANLNLTNNWPPKLMLVGGIVQLGPNFEGGAITNLALNGCIFSNTLPVTGMLTATNSQIEGTIPVSNGGTFIATNTYMYGGVTIASGGLFNFEGGTEVGPLVVDAGGTVDLSGATTFNEAMTNAGTFNLSNAMVGLYIGLINESGGSMDFLGESNIVTYALLLPDEYFIGSQYFVNKGRVIQNSPGGTNTIVLVTVDNSQGTFTNLAGTSVLETFTNLAGVFYAGSGATIPLAGGSPTNFLTPGTPFVTAGPGQIEFTSGYLLLPSNTVPGLLLVGGTLELGANFQGGAITNLSLGGMTLTNVLPVKGTLGATEGNAIYGNLVVTNGGVFNDGGALYGHATVASGGLLNIVGSGLVAAGGSLTVASGATVDITGGGMTLYGPLTNSGTINITNPPGGFLSGLATFNDGSPTYTGSVVNESSGLINLSGDNTVITSFESEKEYLINAGRITKSAGTNFSQVTAAYTTNSGAITAESGAIGMYPFITLPGGSLNVDITSATDYGSFAVETNAISTSLAIGGAFNVTLNNGYVPANGTVFNALTYPAHSGIFSSLSLPGAVSWQSNYGSTDFTLTVGAAVAQYAAALNLSGTNLIFNGTGGTPGGGYQILMTTNLALPLTNWTFVTSNSFNGSGQFRYTNSVNPAKPHEFFIFKSP